ncbi:hypothetical protein F5X98DRAFT_365551 [Xylaria grammica]|nr:hypothetical protein F5X98DRAFT_365551 [Xylaria grammica]
MATNPKSPIERFNDLTNVVSDLEYGFNTNFANWEEENHASAEDYFLWAYAGTVDALRLITDEKWKDDVDSSLKINIDKLFTRALQLLPKSVEYVRITGPALNRVHKGLLKAMLLLAERGDVTVSNGLGVHLVQMGGQLYRIRPPPRGAWNAAASDLKESDEFDGIFQEFLCLEKDPLNKQGQHELYVLQSHRLLERALRALGLPEHEAHPKDDFFHNETRPTFVEYPYGSEEFFYGRGSRPGILHIKSKLGSPLTAAQRMKLGNVDKKGTTQATKQKSDTVGGESVGEKKRKKFKSIDKTKSENLLNKKKRKKIGERARKGSKHKAEKNTKGKNEEKGYKKRLRNDNSKGSRKPRTKQDYTMTIINAAADVEDILRVGRYKSMWDWDADRPDSNRLITPTVDIRKTIMVAYQEDLRSIIDELYKRKFKTPTNKAKLPQTVDERSDWLERANREMRWARAAVHEYIESATTPSRTKQLRLAAYRLKLLRSLHILGLISGEPAASADEIRDGLRDRLEDWILYEQAWNVSELVILERQSITQELWDTITVQVNEREENIQRWTEMLNEFDERVIPGKTGKGGKRQPTEDPDVDASSSSSSSSSSSEEEEDEKEEGKDNVDGMDVDEEEKVNVNEEQKVPKNPETETKPVEEIFLTKEDISNGRIVLHNALYPKLPDSGDYLLDWREEKRRRRWFHAMARAKLMGKPVPAWTHKAPFDPFNAGGPPGWEGLPLGTVWDRLQYMWVLTNWRFFQLRELEP